jgi:hypothetical protein
VSAIYFVLVSFRPLRDDPQRTEASASFVHALEIFRSDPEMPQVLIFVASSLAAQVDTPEHFAQARERVFKAGSKTMFVLVPWFALLLFAAFRKQRRFYVEHLIVALHLHAFFFGLGVVDEILFWCGVRTSGPSWTFAWFTCCIAFSGLALHRVYGQSWPRTLAKTFGIAGVYFTTFAVAFFSVLVAIGASMH